MAQVQIMVGTKKAGFVYTSDEKREQWRLSKPMLPGWFVNHMVADTRTDPARLYIAGGHMVWGRAVARSEDGGETWDARSEGLGFAEDMGVTIDALWHIRPGPASQPGVVYAGTSPAGLFRSEDWGESWKPIDGLNRHELREHWATAGPTGQALHSIEIDPRDPNHIYLNISDGGSYVTLDGGERWHMFSHHAISVSPQAKMFISQGAANVPPGIDPAAAHDMHRLRLDQKNPDRLWTQAHTGVFRSDDGGRSWEDVTDGLPSFHGFPIAVTRREPDAVYVVPLETGTDNFRACPGQFAVYRTRDAGSTWERLTNGLPGPDDYQSSYREGMDTDGLDPEGVYVGTSNGEVYASFDRGDQWQRLPGTLPPVLSVTCAVG